MQTTLFFNNKTQAVRLPMAYRFADDVQKVFVRKIGNERIISPTENVWDSFFDNPELGLGDNFERGEQIPTERERF